MVVTTPTAKTTATAAKTTTTTTDSSSDLVRMLRMNGEGSSYSFGDAGHATHGKKKKRKTSPLLDEWRDYEALRETNFEEEFLTPFFFESGWERQQVIANRFVQVLTTLYKARDDWNRSQEEKKNAAAAAAADEEEDEVSLKAPDRDDPAAVRLCEAVASLGPLAVKMGQTLSQRPDIVGKPACDALKRLQTQNTPFDDDLAYAVIRESLDYWDGPLAGNFDETGDGPFGDSDSGIDIDGDIYSDTKPLFQSISKEPIASASLGQVYKATTWEGVDIALKVQRPAALSVIAIDTQCFRIAGNFRKTLIDLGEQWNGLTDLGKNSLYEQEVEHTLETGMTEDEVRSLGDEGTVASVIDRVAKDIKREMDYRVEAANSYKFRESLSFLGFVDTPDVLLATDKILATRFVNGHHLDALNHPADELALSRMAVEACTASIVLTGFVHADPHEGNLMLREEDGRIVFLDFGLMSDVDQSVMEAFARGIQSLLSEDFKSVTEAFSDSGFITSPIMHRENPEDLWRVDPDYGLNELAVELEHAMRSTEGGLSRFGALATVLNKKISPNWLVFTPPYVLLLIRTFLTLEGIAAQVDPEFNIYEMSLPWVVRRSLSPSTEKGRKVLRNTILKKDNRIQWERVMELLKMQNAVASAEAEAVTATATTVGESETNESSSATTGTSAQQESSAAAVEAAATTTTTEATDSANDKKRKASAIAAARTPEEKERKQKEFEAAQKGAMKDAIGTLLGSTNGKALRGVLKDLDTPDLIWKLGSKEGRPIVKMGTEKALNALFSSGGRGGKTKTKPTTETAPTTATDTASTSTTTTTTTTSKHSEIDNYRPVSEACVELRSKQTQRSKVVTRFLVKLHFRKCLTQMKGVIGLLRLGFSALQIAASLLLRKTMKRIVAVLPSSFRSGTQRQTNPQ